MSRENCNWGVSILVIEQSSLSVSLMAMMLVSPLERDHTALRAILSRSNWRMHSAFGREEAVTLMRSESIPVLICVGDSRDRTWKELLDDAAKLTAGPRLVVSSRLSDDHLWAEVLQAGAYDFLPMPWEAREVLRVISLAWQSWAIGQRPAYERSERTANTRPPSCTHVGNLSLYGD